VTPLLETRALSKRFGELEAVSAVDFRLDRDEVRALIGPDGAGKTTLVSLASQEVVETVRIETHDVLARFNERQWRLTRHLCGGGCREGADESPRGRRGCPRRFGRIPLPSRVCVSTGSRISLAVREGPRKILEAEGTR
jgi:ABC-type branched-subunit amino acid transport system ATPase component